MSSDGVSKAAREGRSGPPSVAVPAPAAVPALQGAIRGLCDCESVWLESVGVAETIEGKARWEEFVEVFELVGHVWARRAYAWGYPTTDGEYEYIVVLHATPVDSPAAAVRITLLADGRI